MSRKTKLLQYKSMQDCHRYYSPRGGLKVMSRTDTRLFGAPSTEMMHANGMRAMITSSMTRGMNTASAVLVPTLSDLETICFVKSLASSLRTINDGTENSTFFQMMSQRSATTATNSNSRQTTYLTAGCCESRMSWHCVGPAGARLASRSSSSCLRFRSFSLSSSSWRLRR